MKEKKHANRNRIHFGICEKEAIRFLLNPTVCLNVRRLCDEISVEYEPNSPMLVLSLIFVNSGIQRETAS